MMPHIVYGLLGLEQVIQWTMHDSLLNGKRSELTCLQCNDLERALEKKNETTLNEDV